MKAKKYRVYVSRRIPETGLALLREKCELEIYPGDQPVPRTELLEKVQNIEGLLCLLSDTVDRELINRAPQLRVISNYAVGYNNIDVAYATTRGIVVTNTPGVLTDATADLTWTLLLAAARRVVEGDREMREKKFSGWSPLYLLGQEITGKTLGLLGAGRIGKAVAERSTGWKMPIIYYDHQPNSELEEKFRARSVALEELIREADFISIHLPLTDATRHLIQRRHFKIMKKTAVLINTARGPIIDESALVEALQRGWIAAAGLDVYENEPAMAPGLEKLPNAVLLPHLGSATVHTRDEMARVAARNLLNVLEGKAPEFPVNLVADQKYL